MSLATEQTEGPRNEALVLVEICKLSTSSTATSAQLPINYNYPPPAAAVDSFPSSTSSYQPCPWMEVSDFPKDAEEQ